jgi:hypothetical protein
MKRKGSRFANKIMQEYNKKKYYEGLAKRKKQVGDKNGGTTK